MSKRAGKTKEELTRAEKKLVDTNPGHFSMVRNFQVADLITLLNGACGAMSIHSNMRYLVNGNTVDLWLAIILMPLGMMFDFLDGRVARWRNESSLLGQELDSLADLVSFGVAPSVLGFVVGMRTPLDAMVFTYFIVCGIARLARYNATVAIMPKDANGKINYFEGTPIPTTLGVVGVIAYFISQNRVGANLPFGVWPLLGMEIHPFVGLFALSGTLMISKTLRIPKP
ncbi:hypothetical protein BZG36_04765 [Bifiguratus adelaidae]|uniref:CDP-diacylglycerol--serine O-phosphatidyltransferase n=1 Tax=Bifiguratus adelaidae TaxID=1938954 RepID=A0A261XVN0_9FUNG|nr:hypothetical protein BZG36_04765 [Bifiguratus adelaidae]